jgi:16S rRNA (guanine(966)-N(2))-methyltransferase RsmD
MRVIAGSASGLRLAAPKDPLTRPISDKVKESLFGTLGERVLGARFLDLYAGSGAIGIEALSRGAEHATFVEHARTAITVIRENLERTGLAERADVHARKVEAFLADATATWDIAVLDPPYAERTLDLPLERLRPRLAPDGLVVVKHFWRTPMPPAVGLAVIRSKRFGETALTFLEEER